MNFSRQFIAYHQRILSNLILERSLKATAFAYQTQICFRHNATTQGENLRPLKVTNLARGRGNKVIKRSAQKIGETRMHSGQFSPESVWKDTLEEGEDDDGDMDNLAFRISKYSSKYAYHAEEEDHMRQTIKTLKSIRYKTIENKFFRKAPALNLLSWSAKEQIRYLHKENPEEWSVEKFSLLFPVSAASIKKIIKSKVRLIKSSQILEHDTHVYNNWATIKATLESDQYEIADDVLQYLKNSVDEITVTNADGLVDLPFPNTNSDRYYPRGDFSPIVKDCYDVKRDKRGMFEEEMRQKSEQFSRLLSDISQILKLKSESPVVKSRFNDISGKRPATVDTRQNATTNNVSTSRVHHNSHLDRASNLILKKYLDQQTYTQDTKDSAHIKKDVATRVPVNKMGTEQSKQTFMSGDCVYDENGEFLYRIP